VDVRLYHCFSDIDDQGKQRFDLKGINSRQSKPEGKSDQPGWDADWVEGSFRTLLLIHPHSKNVSRIRFKARFLVGADGE
jgi:inner membrane protein involved in colicin E2 resistance